jgi:hypothetical protein
VIRLGFVLAPTNMSWMGGINYMHNLLPAISGSNKIELVIVTSRNAPAAILSDFDGFEIIQSDLVDPASRLWLPRKAAERLYGRAFALEGFLRSRNIAVLSHSGHGTQEYDLRPPVSGKVQ